nr:MAG: ORF1 [TTV-like mini virus]
MPYYWRRRYWRPRRRFWRRRARKTFRRRYWRRRRTVRKFRKKLHKITVKEWQPKTINKLKVTGFYPLFEGTKERLGNNNTMYIDSIAPHLIPSGGCFSINVFTLKALYELHLKARNWWTKSNCRLPLIKYLGCKLNLYRSSNADYVFVYANCGDMKANEQMFQSTQPSVLLLNKNKRIVTCDPNNCKRKPYKTVKIRPPAMFQNKWYFQSDLANIPLLLTITSACSLQRYYIPSTAISSTIGFWSLNTKFIKYHQFKQPSATTGYRPNDEWSLYSVGGIHTSWESASFKNLIYLANTKDYTLGKYIDEIPNNSNFTNKVDKYFQSLANWGNPFAPQYLKQDSEAFPVLGTKKTLDEVKNLAKQENGGKLLKDNGFILLNQELLTHCRYNPQADQSHNAAYLAQIVNDNTQWHEPTETTLITKGLPLWLLLQGYLDYHLKSQQPQRPTTDYCLVLVSDHISPTLDSYVPLDNDVVEGRSPYETDEGFKRDADKLNWHPKCNFQLRTINNILSTGPGTVKLPDRISCEAKCKYTFYFKLGGCPPPMDDVCDPQKQPKYPTPNNILSTTLLQDPATPPQYFLNCFDQRRGMLTKKAAKRIKTDFETKELIFPPTGTTSMDIQIPSPETTSTEDSSEEEKDPQTLQFSLKRQRRKQRKLRNRILELLNLAQELK